MQDLPVEAQVQASLQRIVHQIECRADRHRGRDENGRKQQQLHAAIAHRAGSDSLNGLDERDSFQLAAASAPWAYCSKILLNTSLEREVPTRLSLKPLVSAGMEVLFSTTHFFIASSRSR